MRAVCCSSHTPVPDLSAREPHRVLQRACTCGGAGQGCAACRTRRTPHIVYEALSSAGSALDPATRTTMEGRFQHDFSRVRVHADATAARSADAVGARAYTVGHDVVFGDGQYAPTTARGQRLLAHELTHALQQRDAPRSGDITLEESRSDREREADDFASRVDRGETVGTPAAAPVTLAREDKPPAPSTEDCSRDQARMLKNHLDDARAWVNDAAPKVDAYAYVYANPRVTAVPASPSTMTIVRDTLRDNFHTSTADGVLSIKDGFLELRSALNRSLTFECEDEGCDDQAYVRGAFAAIRRLGDIHVCPPWFNCRDYYRRVTTIIHERAHQYPGATDNAYEWQGSYATMSLSDAVDNADSYAVAARQIYHGGARGPGMPQC
jgi:hypothetical protein